MPPPLLPQFFRYASAGAIGTAAHYSVLIVFVQFTGAVSASTVGAIFGALINYALNRRFTFASRRTHRVALLRFLAVAGAGILLNTATIAAVLALFHPHFLVAQLVATSIVLMIAFLANRKWTF